MMKRGFQWLSCFAFLACTSGEQEVSQPAILRKGDTVFVSKQTELFGKLKLQQLSSQAIAGTLKSRGVVEIPPAQQAFITLPFSGRITKVYVKLGQQVKAGAPLFEMQSPEFILSQKEFFKAKAEEQTARIHWKRQKQMYDHELISLRDYELSKLEYEQAHQEYVQAKKALEVFQMDTSKLTLGQPLLVKAPIHGEIIEQLLVVGSYIKEEDMTAIRIAQLENIWISAQLKEKDMPNLSDLVSATLINHDSLAVDIYYISPEIKTDNRSVSILLAAKNPKGVLKPGMFVDVEFKLKSANRLLLPASAILQQGLQSYVYMQGAADSIFIRREVQTAAVYGDQIEIKSGLNEGTQILADGAFYLLNKQH